MRRHIILLAMDNIGLQAISLMVTESNTRLEVRGKLQYPCLNKEILEKYIGPGTMGHGHVYVTSACIGGVIAGMAMERDLAAKKLKESSSRLDDNDKVKEAITTIESQIGVLSLQKEDLVSHAKATGFARRLTLIKKSDMSPDEMNAAIQAVEAEMQKAEQAKADLPEIRKKIQALTKNRTILKQRLLPERKEKELARAKAVTLKIASSDDVLLERMRDEMSYYKDLAGDGNFAVEIQYHGLDSERKWMPVLDAMAHELGIPVIAANDEHMIEREDAEARKYLNALRFFDFQYEEPSDSEREMYFKSDADLYRALRLIIPKEHAIEAMMQVGKVIERCNASITSEPHYPRFNDTWTKEQSEGALERAARKGIPSRYPTWTDELEQRLRYELSVINQMGFTDYFLIVQWYLAVGSGLGHMPDERFGYLKEHVREMDLKEIYQYIGDDQSEPGMSTGPGRGSAAGSLVCYLTGITKIDPIKNHLVFERFLNPERVSMPDIDADFSKKIRDVLIEIVKKKYGTDGVCGIMTRTTLAAKAAIQMVSKVQGTKRSGNSKQFLSLGIEMSSIIPQTPGAMIADYETEITDKYKDDPDAMEILKIAKQLEGIYYSTGQHAAGVVIADDGDIRLHTPLMWDPEKSSWKSQMDKDEIEKNKMLKMDFLGLVNLDIITDTIRIVKKRHPELTKQDLDMNLLPMEDEVFALFADADTDSVFQFESDGMKNMLRRFKPSTFEDLTLLVAAYRPGPMQFLEEVIRVKHGGQASYLTPELIPILKDTYGQIIYQEQVMQIFRDLAGYSLGGADLVRRAMGHKEMQILQVEREAFVSGDPSRGISGCVSKGISREIANRLFDQMMKFAEYAFNKSHAAAYAFVAYITAYLKHHYPAEYYCTVMSYEKAEKIPNLVTGCRRRGIGIHAPDINISESGMSVYKDCIYFGLGSVKNAAKSAGVIIQERAKGGKYTSIRNFLERTGCKKNAFEALTYAGAFDDLADRSWIISHFAEIEDGVKKAGPLNESLTNKLNILTAYDNEEYDKAKQLTDGKKVTRKVLVNSIAKLRASLAEAEAVFSDHEPVRLDKFDMLGKEKEVLGAFISSTPLAGYRQICETTAGVPVTSFANVVGSDVRVLCYPENKEVKKTKKDKTDFITFTADTPLGQIDAVSFFKAPVNRLKKAEKCLVVTGRIRKGKADDGELQLIVDAVEDAVAEFIDLLAFACPDDWKLFEEVCGQRVKNPKNCQYRVSQMIDKDSGMLYEVNVPVNDVLIKAAKPRMEFKLLPSD